MLYVKELESEPVRLYGRFTLPDESTTQFITSTGLGTCLLADGDKVKVTLEEEPENGLDKGKLSLKGVWSEDICPKCEFNPVSPKFPELGNVCQAALKSGEI